MKIFFKKLINNLKKHPLLWLFSISFVLMAVGFNRLIYQFNSFNETGNGNPHIISQRLNDPLHMNLFSIAYIFHILFIIVACFKLYKWLKELQSSLKAVKELNAKLRNSKQ